MIEIKGVSLIELANTCKYFNMVILYAVYKVQLPILVLYRITNI